MTIEKNRGKYERRTGSEHKALSLTELIDLLIVEGVIKRTDLNKIENISGANPVFIP